MSASEPAVGNIPPTTEEVRRSGVMVALTPPSGPSRAARLRRWETRDRNNNNNNNNNSRRYLLPGNRWPVPPDDDTGWRDCGREALAQLDVAEPPPKIDK